MALKAISCLVQCTTPFEDGLQLSFKPPEAQFSVLLPQTETLASKW